MLRPQSSSGEAKPILAETSFSATNAGKDEEASGSFLLAPMIAYHCDRELRYTWIVNPHPQFSPDLILGKRDDEIHPAADVRALMEFKRQVLGTGISAQQLLTFHYGGQNYHYSLTAQPMHDSTGTVTGLMVAAHDPDGFAQNALAVEQERGKATLERLRLDAVLEAMPAGVIIADATGRLVKTNHTATKIWGGFPEETPDIETYREFVGYSSETGKRIEPNEWAMARALKQGEVIEAQRIDIERFDGETATILNSAAPIYDTAGQIVGGVVSMTDITQQTRAESAFHASEERLRLATSIAGIGTWDAYPLKNDYGWDAQCKALFGYSPDFTMDDEAFLTRIHPDDRKRVDQVLTSAIDPKGRGIYRVEFRLNLPKEEGERWLTAQGQAEFAEIEGKRVCVRFTGVVMDITPLKRNEEKLRLAMRETHHRVRNNLQLIAALIDIQKMSYQDEPIVEEFRRLNSHVKAMAAVHDLLTQEAKRDAEANSIDAHFVLTNLLPLLQGIANHRIQAATLDHARLLSRQGTSLALVANELLLNALKHSEGKVEIEFRVENNYATLSVTDEGAGLPANFDPTASGNTGLNLIESVGRWDLNGETFYANREDGKGAKISIRFPIQEKNETL